MVENLPHWISALFLLIAIVTIILFHFANGKPAQLTFFIVLWSLSQSILAFSGFYEKIDVMPPRFLLVLLPVLGFMIFGVTKKRLDWVTQNRRIQICIFIHTVRIPVEIVLFYLFTYKMVPELMTFEGRNFDIVAGITAPIIGFLWLKKSISRKVLIVWNVVALFLVLFIFINATLSADLPIQLFGFEQPNRAVYYFPFVLLPATIVPIVIYTHITDLIVLIKNKKAQT